MLLTKKLSSPSVLWLYALELSSKGTGCGTSLEKQYKMEKLLYYKVFVLL